MTTLVVVWMITNTRGRPGMKELPQADPGQKAFYPGSGSVFVAG